MKILERVQTYFQVVLRSRRGQRSKDDVHGESIDLREVHRKFIF